jgi:hypothetical protein
VGLLYEMLQDGIWFECISSTFYPRFLYCLNLALTLWSEKCVLIDVMPSSVECRFTCFFFACLLSFFIVSVSCFLAVFAVSAYASMHFKREINDMFTRSEKNTVLTFLNASDYWRKIVIQQNHIGRLLADVRSGNTHRNAWERYDVTLDNITWYWSDTYFLIIILMQWFR